VGEWRVGPIGSPASLLASVRLHLSGPEYFRHLLAKRRPDSNKGSYGHVLVVGGAPGKTGAAEMAGVAALRAGAGLVTVACSADRLFTPELMTASLAPAFDSLPVPNKDVIAMGPGLGVAPELVLETIARARVPLVLDADALNSLVGQTWRGGCCITPHPGEMARLAGTAVAEVQKDRLGIARAYAVDHGCTVVLKGHRTVIAFPDGRAWINPTGTAGMATGGTGDILTGLIAGFLAQSPSDAEAAVIAAVYLHGLAGELGARSLGEQALLATDLLTWLPEAIRVCRNVPNVL
jgi:NAD(P)H-hydrate epimerase